MYYDYQKVLSYNALFYFIIGERGVGKSYGAKKIVINDFLKNDNEFVYLRRYKTELKASVPKWYDDLKANNEYPDTKLSINNNKFIINDRVGGYALSLSTANILKSTSFAKVRTIIFDEFIIDKGTYHYLSNEVIQLLDIVETIGRLRDVRVLFLGNAISITNPYFTYFNLHLPYNSDIAKFKDGLIVVNYIKNDVFRQVKKESRFGKLISDTTYGKYAIDNEFLRDSKAFISKKPSNAKFYFTIYLTGLTLGVWIDYKNDDIYISKKYDANCPITFSFNINDHSERTILAHVRINTWIKSVINHYRLSKLFFESQDIKNIFMDTISKYLTY